ESGRRTVESRQTRETLCTGYLPDAAGRSAEDLVDSNRGVRKLRGRDGPATRYALEVPVPVASRVTGDLDRLAGDVYDPHLRDAGPRVQAALDRAVIGQRGVSDLDDEERLSLCGIACPVGAPLQKGEVRLRLGARAGPDGALHPHEGPSPDAKHQHLHEHRH